MASKRLLLQEDDDDGPAWPWGINLDPQVLPLPHTAARQAIRMKMTNVVDFDVTKRLDDIVQAMSDISTDVRRLDNEPDRHYYERIKRTLGLIPYWMINNVDFDAEHPYQGWKGIIYDNGNVAVSKIKGNRWIDVYIAVSACVLLAEGRHTSRFIEDITEEGDWLSILVGT